MSRCQNCFKEISGPVVQLRYCSNECATDFEETVIGRLASPQTSTSGSTAHVVSEPVVKPAAPKPTVPAALKNVPPPPTATAKPSRSAPPAGGHSEAEFLDLLRKTLTAPPKTAKPPITVITQPIPQPAKAAKPPIEPFRMQPKAAMVAKPAPKIEEQQNFVIVTPNRPAWLR